MHSKVKEGNLEGEKNRFKYLIIVEIFLIEHMKKQFSSKLHMYIYHLVLKSKKFVFNFLLNNLTKLPLFTKFQTIFVTVRKPQKAETLEQQTVMVTDDIFKTLFGADKHMRRILLKEDGAIWLIRHPGHKYIYRIGGKGTHHHTKTSNF